jgi:hypothetical protein
MNADTAFRLPSEANDECILSDGWTSETIKKCLDIPAKNRILLIGDSHSQAMLPGLSTLPNVEVAHAIRYDCNLSHEGDQGCSDFTDSMKSVLPEVLRAEDVVIMVTWHMGYYSFNGMKQKDPSAYYKRFEDMNKDWKDISDIIAQAGASLVLFEDYPNMSVAGITGAECYDTPWRTAHDDQCLFRKPDFSKEYKLLWSGLKAHFFMTYDLFCDDAQCGAYIPGTAEVSLYDRDHLSSSGSHYLGPFICSFLNERNLLPPKDEL